MPLDIGNAVLSALVFFVVVFGVQVYRRAQYFKQQPWAARRAEKKHVEWLPIAAASLAFVVALTGLFSGTWTLTYGGFIALVAVIVLHKYSTRHRGP